MNAPIICDHSAQSWSKNRATGEIYCSDCEAPIARSERDDRWYRVPATTPALPSCSFRIATQDTPPDPAWQTFAELHDDFHKGRYLYLQAPAAVVDVTPGRAFAEAIVGAMEEVEQLRAALLDAIDGCESQAAMPTPEAAQLRARFGLVGK